MRNHLTPVGITIIKNKTEKEICIGEDLKKREPPYTVGGNVNLYRY